MSASIAAFGMVFQYFSFYILVSSIFYSFSPYLLFLSLSSYASLCLSFCFFVSVFMSSLSLYLPFLSLSFISFPLHSVFVLLCLSFCYSMTGPFFVTLQNNSTTVQCTRICCLDTWWELKMMQTLLRHFIL
jgi:hypothetical protein